MHSIKYWRFPVDMYIYSRHFIVLYLHFIIYNIHVLYSWWYVQSFIKSFHMMNLYFLFYRVLFDHFSEHCPLHFSFSIQCLTFMFKLCMHLIIISYTRHSIICILTMDLSCPLTPLFMSYLHVLLISMAILCNQCALQRTLRVLWTITQRITENN